MPSDWKIARVTPVYKNKGSKDDPGNYRPISVVPTVTKIIEKNIKAQLVNYFTMNNFFCPEQFAYLKNHSTCSAIHTLVDKWLDNINNRKINGICQLDLSKGFDTVNIEIFLYKLKKYGISDHALGWFKSYFTDRTQLVTCDGILSKPRHLIMGVPQGTVLGPICFLIYINDFPSHILSGDALMYADDSNLSAHGNNIEELQSNLQACLTEASGWFDANRLVVNENKSTTMVITSPRGLNSITPLHIILNNNELPYCTSSKLLGVVIDNSLKWDKHIQYICAKISPKIGLIHRLRQILPTSNLSTIYLTLIQPYIDYCITVWGACANKYIKQLQRLQNRAARAVTGIFDYHASVSAMIHTLKWMTVENRYKYFLAILAYKCYHREAPIILANRFTRLD